MGPDICSIFMIMVLVQNIDLNIREILWNITVDGKETVILAPPVCFEVNGKVKELL